MWGVRKFGIMGVAALSAFSIASGLLPFSGPAMAEDEIVILSAWAMRATLDSMQPVLAKAAHGLPVHIVYGTALDIATHARATAAYDMVILPSKPLWDLVREGLVRKGDERPLGKVNLGFAIKAGTPRPDMSSVDAMMASLRATPSIGYVDPASGATTGLYLTMMFKQMNLFDDMKVKQHLFADGTLTMAALARGEIALAAGQLCDAVNVKGIEVLGPLPAGAAFTTTYVAAPAAHATHGQIAIELRDTLASDAFRDALKLNGFEPL